MKIKSKLLVLMAVPLLALGAIAILGFRSQSVNSAASSSSQIRVDQTVAVNNTVSAIAAERLGLLGAVPEGELNALEGQTDTAIASLEALERPIATNQLSEFAEAVSSARASNDPWRAAGFYSAANNILLAQNQSGANEFADGDLLNDWLVSSLTAQATEARDQAWLNYFAEASSVNPDIAQIVSGFALADQAQAQAIQLSSGTNRSILDTAQANESALELRTTQTQALRDLRNGTFTVTATQLTAALTANSTSLSAALSQIDNNLATAAAANVNDSAAQRQLFSLLGIVGAIVLGGLVFVIYRSITNPLTNLLDRADHIANVQLPALVRKLRTTSNAESLPNPPQIPSTSSDEIGELVHAFNQMQTTAHTLATEQAISRRNVSDMFINLGRRNQQLLQRMLRMVTELEQDEADPDTLESLFALDQLVTRMRRNAESLLVLAGTQAPRQWSKPVSVENAVRGSIAEVEDYTRVDVEWLDAGFVQGSIVADVAHLLAEILENALAYSDPTMPVQINGEVSADGYLISVTDFGIGLDAEEIRESNLRISSPPPLDQAPTQRLGLFVVGRLAERHGIQVQLVPGARQGIVARIEIPRSDLVMDTEMIVPSMPSAPAVEAAEAAPELPQRQEQAPVKQTPSPDLFDYEQLEPEPEHAITSPLGQFHDVDAELEELTSPPIQGWDEAPAVQNSFDSGAALPTRQPVAATQLAPQPQQAAPQQAVPQQLAPQPQQAVPQQAVPQQLAPLPVRRAGDSGDLPVRRPGGQGAAAAAPASAASNVAPVTPTPEASNTEAQASQFSSLMSAFSTGVSKGLEDSFDNHDSERRSQ